MAFTYSKDDVARNTVVNETVWLPVVVADYSEKVSKKQGREGISNHIVTLKCDEEGNEYKGLVLVATFPEDYPTMAFPFMTAVGEPPQKGGGSFEFSEQKGKRILACVQPDEYQGKPTNRIVDYRPIDWTPEMEG